MEQLIARLIRKWLTVVDDSGVFRTTLEVRCDNSDNAYCVGIGVKCHQMMSDVGGCSLRSHVHQTK